MIEILIARRDSLKQDLVRATDILAKKKAEIEELNGMMLRINGAIQALDETIEEKQKEGLSEQSESSS